MILNFYREGINNWYIDLPEYIEKGGSKSALAMVAGADDLLSELSGGRPTVSINICSISKEREYAEDGHILLKRQISIPIINLVSGATYNIESGIPGILTKLIWLCPVTLFVFGGKYPKRILCKPLYV